MNPNGPLFHKPKSIIAARNILYAALFIAIILFVLQQFVFIPSGQMIIRTVLSAAVLLILQYVAIYFIGFGKKWARLLFLLLFTLTLISSPVYLSVAFKLSPLLTFLFLLQIILQAVAVYFLFKKSSNDWLRSFDGLHHEENQKQG